MSDNPEVQRALTMLTEATSIIRRQSGSGYDSTSGMPRTAQTTPDRVAELRNLFQPYNITGRIRPGTSAAVRGQQRRQNPPRPWSNRVFCLNDPHTTMTPTIPIKMQLQNMGLGLEMVQLDMNSGADVLESAIRATFPKLDGKPFELLRALSGGDNKPLIRVSVTHEIPPVAYLTSIIRRGTIYVRPKEPLMILMNDQSDNLDGTAANSGSRGQQTQEQEVGIDMGGFDAASSESVAFGNNASEPVPAINSNIDRNEPIQGTSRALYAEIQMDDQNTIEFATLDEFRAGKIRGHSGAQVIHVRREDFTTEVVGQYLKGSINLYKEPNIFFSGEPGRDFGALRREYFHEGINAITNGKYDGRFPIFDGEIDHKLPSTNAALLRGSIFEAVGKFMVHSIIHTGIGCIGLSDAMVEYLTSNSVSTNTSFAMNLNDVTQHEVRQALMAINNWEGQAPDPDVLRNIQDVAWDSGYEVGILFENRIMAAQHILYHHVVEKRRPQLDAIKIAFLESGLTKFLSDRPYLVSGAFPQHKDLLIPANLVLQKIEFFGEETSRHLLETLKNYILEISPDGERSKQILMAWTGWPLLPEGSLIFKVEDDVDFVVHACTNEIIVPSNWKADDLRRTFNILFDHGAAGFGVV